jgi:hypothetical protein
MKGYGHMRETLGRIRADCRAARDSHLAVSPPPAYLRRLNLPWRPILGFLVFFEAFRMDRVRRAWRLTATAVAG